ncbi:hypothetical protein [Tengunoibacter tsumagoiensis]|uniref:Uncharacterized protein n=1 Tax=Tengunoibacter tsumagoiensis TaxID=2014871 RepID=A0A402A7W4_9CHLR|nr:hypothetical protein [Tengunoibacter tsumagoiensis]GCE15071.1 hypothetical protein KTT_49300 [Tengunoibacter tsumagoiensis]
MASNQWYLPEEWNGIDALDQEQQDTSASFPRAPELHIAIESDASYKIGTCEHCVLFEQGRPDRAWDAEGDNDLDFNRDHYFSLLTKLGIVMNDRQAYVCP